MQGLLLLISISIVNFECLLCVQGSIKQERALQPFLSLSPRHQFIGLKLSEDQRGTGPHLIRALEINLYPHPSSPNSPKDQNHP